MQAVLKLLEWSWGLFSNTNLVDGCGVDISNATFIATTCVNLLKIYITYAYPLQGKTSSHMRTHTHTRAHTYTHAHTHTEKNYVDYDVMLSFCLQGFIGQHLIIQSWLRVFTTSIV